jgi:thiamine biosynthesis lipoprotein
MSQFLAYRGFSLQRAAPPTKVLLTAFNVVVALAVGVGIAMYQVRTGLTPVGGVAHYRGTPLDPGPSALELLDATHPHLFASAFLLFVLGHLFALTRASARRKTQLALLGFAAVVVDAAALTAAVRRTYDSLRVVDSLLSTYRDDSEISRVNRGAGGGPTPVSPTFAAVLDEALRTARRSSGAFDPAGGRWRGIAWDPATGRVALPAGAALDFGGIAKGYALDRAALALAGAADSAVLSVGGQLLVLGGGPGRPVGIADPDNPLALLALLDGPAGRFSVSTSSQGEQPGHIVDPGTGRAAERARSVSVLARTGIVADAWSTALFVLGCDRALALAEEMDGLDVLCADESVRWTADLDGRVALPTAAPPPGPGS